VGHLEALSKEYCILARIIEENPKRCFGTRCSLLVVEVKQDKLPSASFYPFSFNFSVVHNYD